MFYYALQANTRRTVIGCNYNHRLNECHPDRILSEHDLIYIVRGQWEIFQENIAYRIDVGDALLLQAGRRHYGLNPCDGEVETMFIHFSACCEDALTDCVKAQPECYSFPAFSHVPRIRRCRGCLKR